MKSAFRLLIFASALFAVAFAYPGARSASSESDEDFEKVGPILVLSDDLEDGFGGSFFSSFPNNPFDGFLTRMQREEKKLCPHTLWDCWRDLHPETTIHSDKENDVGWIHQFNSDVQPSWDGDMMKRLREQVAASLPDLGSSDGLYDIPKIPEGANTTSTTKVINGHVVTVNETTYSDGDENSGTVLRVRVVDIKPVNETENPDSEDVTTPANNEPPSSSSSSPDRSVESLEDFSKNEIPDRLVAI
ncbi:icarapin-like isoform X1 [Neodiprion lecontei]|uniref:Icarapin-like isoform X1 n=1 Tax=Neodiprion lecontei TaxID=441921 RepID=A0ABM3FGR8_NEOLC|nr:icarapin-like isoform X1 [Neodiprion lecontei]XP_046587214.1 icarapin-like isoform X1 [Neodiprion lecontei]XP_046587215.1 icarapin-like isoform X1 [Neodiprion lecontei]